MIGNVFFFSCTTISQIKKHMKAFISVYNDLKKFTMSAVKMFAFFIFWAPNMLGHTDNYIPANPLVTPPHIQPEWYFLFAYTILRSIPDKLLGVLGMGGAILVLLVLPFTHTCYIRSHQFRPIAKFLYWLLVADFLILTWIGACAPEAPWVLIGQISSILYFAYFLLITPAVGILENKLLKLNF